MPPPGLLEYDGHPQAREKGGFPFLLHFRGSIRGPCPLAGNGVAVIFKGFQVLEDVRERKTAL